MNGADTPRLGRRRPPCGKAADSPEPNFQENLSSGPAPAPLHEPELGATSPAPSGRLLLCARLSLLSAFVFFLFFFFSFCYETTKTGQAGR